MKNVLTRKLAFKTSYKTLEKQFDKKMGIENLRIFHNARYVRLGYSRISFF